MPAVRRGHGTARDEGMYAVFSLIRGAYVVKTDNDID